MTADEYTQHLAEVRCAECGCSSRPGWPGWRAYRTDDPELHEASALALFCPQCAEREFDYDAD
jgi:hypothetical protein